LQESYAIFYEVLHNFIIPVHPISQSVYMISYHDVSFLCCISVNINQSTITSDGNKMVV